MRRSVPVLVMLALSLVLFACQKPSAPQPATQPQTPATTAPSPWKLTLATVPDPPDSEQPTIFRLFMKDTAGKSISGARVKASLIMPLMDMGRNEFDFVDKGGGAYEGAGKFTMTGPWNVVVTAAAQGKSGQQTFSVVVHR